MRQKTIGLVVLIGLVVAMAPSSAQAGGPARVWNSAADFRVSPNESNPSPDSYGNADVWSYLHSDEPIHDPAHYQPFSHYSVIASNVEQWDTGTPGLAFLVGNESSLHEMILHPNQACYFGCSLYAIIGWRSPINGVVDIYGDLHLPSTTVCGVGSGINWSIDRGSASITSGSLTAGGTGAFSATTTVHSGDTLYFVDDPGHDTFCDLTFVNLTIAETQAPAATGSSATVTGHSINDRFAGPGIDAGVWGFGTNQPDAISLSQGAGHVTVNVSAAASNNFGVGLGTLCAAGGDFDAQLSFNLVQWPASDGVWVSLIASGTPFNAYRASASWFDSYGTYLPPAGNVVPASGSTGALRLVRVASTWTGYYLADRKWVAIASGEGPTDDLGLSILVFNGSDATVFGGQTAVVQFTEFQLRADRIICP